MRIVHFENHSDTGVEIMKRLLLLLQLSISALFLSSCNNAHSPTSSNTPTWQPAPAKAARIAHPQQIALLLPLSGPLAPYANAIRNGFTAAAQEQRVHSNDVPTINVIDTTGKNIVDSYNTAVAQGASLIVGPLEKNDVAMLNNDQSLSVPVIALNTTQDDVRVNNKIYEYALSPENEAQQAAIKNYQDGHRAVIILAPNNPWGHRLTTAFSTQWKSMGGSIVATQYYEGIPSLSRKISNVLGINNEYRDDHTVSTMLRERVRYIPQRRQDFDSIFMVATPTAAKQIKPLLRFYFAGNIPVYTTSQINAGSQDREHDLDGIQFCEMPWVLAPNRMPAYVRAIQQNIQHTYPNNYAGLSKFYAMGVDAFTLATDLNHLPTQPPGQPGATGSLYLAQNHHIERTLMWAKYVNGSVQ